MENKDQPAYPISYDSMNHIHMVGPDSSLIGLTKRELFMKAAMQGLCANSDGVMMQAGNRSFQPETIAIVALKIADACLSALSPTEEK